MKVLEGKGSNHKFAPLAMLSTNRFKSYLRREDVGGATRWWMIRHHVRRSGCI